MMNCEDAIKINNQVHDVRIVFCGLASLDPTIYNICLSSNDSKISLESDDILVHH